MRTMPAQHMQKKRHAEKSNNLALNQQPNAHEVATANGDKKRDGPPQPGRDTIFGLPYSSRHGPFRQPCGPRRGQDGRAGEVGRDARPKRSRGRAPPELGGDGALAAAAATLNRRHRARPPHTRPMGRRWLYGDVTAAGRNVREAPSEAVFTDSVDGSSSSSDAASTDEWLVTMSPSRRP
uniref:Uncharacterized protein n=1 Tax=Oryza glumipatula TaxID=40148 RepID=A0A0E0BQ16_9ORYZ